MNNQMRKGSGSDYIKAKKQNAIYLGIKTNAQLTEDTVNPMKKNGFFYNNNIIVDVPANCSVANGCSGGIMTYARSYELRLDFKRGKFYNNYVCKCKNDQINDVNPRTCEATLINGKQVLNCLCSPCAFN
jgi:hypothetical protein